jgi:hypothetical protein
VIRSRCGGFGSENVFAVEAVQAGEMYVSVQTNGPRPVISFRASCAESSELSCASYSPDVPYAAVLTAYIPGPGTYLLAVDLEDGFGGSYILNAQFS